MKKKAIIFDIDGTLIDSVDLHAEAWQRALRHFGKAVSFESVREQIGKGGNELLPEFLTPSELERRGEQIKEYRSELFRNKYLSQIKPFPQVRELFLRLKEIGIKIAIGSSAKEQELKHYLKLLSVEDLVDVKTSSDDVRRAKPHPDIFQVALERLALRPSEVVVIGDSPYDAEAATKAKIASIGFLSGGFAEDSLRAAGMTQIYEDPEDFLDKISSGSVKKSLEYFFDNQ